MKKKKRYDDMPYYRNSRSYKHRCYEKKHKCEHSRNKFFDPWHDQCIPDNLLKNWKKNRKTQYREGGRGAEHFIIVDCQQLEWRHYDSQVTRYIEKFFDRQKIPYRTEDIICSKAYMSWWHVPYRTSTLLNSGEIITWWSDKDVGIEYLLKTLPQPSTLLFCSRAWE